MRRVTAFCLMFFTSSAYACFLSGEQTSGMNKICYYKCVEGTRAITVSAVSLWPLSLNKPLIFDDLASNNKGTDSEASSPAALSATIVIANVSGCNRKSLE
jgi:hypothetical protein